MSGNSKVQIDEGELAELRALLARSTLFSDTAPHVHVVPSTCQAGIGMFFSYGLVAISLTVSFWGL